MNWNSISFRERLAWVCLLTTVTLYAFYFSHIVKLLRADALSSSALLGSFIGVVALQTVIAIVAGIAVAVGTRNDPKDERDRAISGRANRNAYVVLAFGVGCVIFGEMACAVFPAFCWSIFATPAASSQVLFFCFVVAEIAKYFTEAISYRGGISH